MRMDNKKKTFRFEKKYLISRDTAYLLKQRLSYILRPDPSAPGGKYTVSSVYFDDQYNTSFYEKQSGDLKRDKFRIRYYNGDTGITRLERKHKYGEMVHKESALLITEQYRMMNCGEYAFMTKQPNPVFDRFYTAHVLKHMRPVITVDYTRQAYVHQAGNVRITFDTGLSASLPAESYSFSVSTDGNIILEVKYDHFLPAFIDDLLAGFTLTRLAISKFVMAKLVLQGMHINNRTVLNDRIVDRTHIQIQ